jgi:hypothetical protein
MVQASAPASWPAHVPHEATLRISLQLSARDTLPQVAPILVHRAAFVSAGHRQTLAAPPPPQVCGAAQVPQAATVRLAAQLSFPVTVPQFLPRREQNAASVSGWQPQVKFVPPPPHVLAPLQVPHEATARLAPQLSLAVVPPHVRPFREQNVVSVSAVQPHTFAVPPPAHVFGDAHVPHEATVRDVPQLSGAVTAAQFLPSRVQKSPSVSGLQQTELVPQTCGGVHVPHEATVRDAPQLSAAVTAAQFLPSRVQKSSSVSAMHPQTLLAPHVSGSAHVPHDDTVRLSPQLSASVTLPQSLPSREQNAVSVSGA